MSDINEPWQFYYNMTSYAWNIVQVIDWQLDTLLKKW